MNLVDVSIIAVAMMAISRGVQVGLFRQALSVGGFFVGLFTGSLLAPQLASLSTEPLIRALLTVGVTLGLGLLLSAIGEYTGSHLTDFADRFHLSSFNAVLGAVFEVGTVVISAWLIAAATSNLPFTDVSREINQSKIVQALNQTLPPAPGLIARIGHLINPNGFPKVFISNEPNPSASGPPDVDTQATLAHAGASTVKIEGLGCGGIIAGSGFVAGPDIVATNAHVVAGVKRPVVIDANGRHAATAIWFDPDLDLAVLRTTNLAGPPLPLLRQDEPVGTSAVILGYPGGGPLTANPAVIADRTRALGRDIYDRNISFREIYALDGDVEPGNSGGPVVLTDGSVIGMVFARSVTRSNIGFALTSRDVTADLTQAQNRNQPTGTGSCAQ